MIQSQKEKADLLTNWWIFNEQLYFIFIIFFYRIANVLEWEYVFPEAKTLFRCFASLQQDRRDNQTEKEWNSLLMKNAVECIQFSNEKGCCLVENVFVNSGDKTEWAHSKRFTKVAGKYLNLSWGRLEFVTSFLFRKPFHCKLG